MADALTTITKPGHHGGFCATPVIGCSESGARIRQFSPARSGTYGIPRSTSSTNSVTMVHMENKKKEEVVKAAIGSLSESELARILPEGWVNTKNLVTHRMLFERFFEPYGLTKQLLSARFRRGIYDIEPVIQLPGATLYDSLAFKAIHDRYERSLRKNA